MRIPRLQAPRFVAMLTAINFNTRHPALPRVVLRHPSIEYASVEYGRLLLCTEVMPLSIAMQVHYSPWRMLVAPALQGNALHSAYLAK